MSVAGTAEHTDGDAPTLQTAWEKSRSAQVAWAEGRMRCCTAVSAEPGWRVSGRGLTEAAERNKVMPRTKGKGKQVDTL